MGKSMNNLFFDSSKLKYCGENVIIGKTVIIKNPEEVTIGNNVIIDDFSYISGTVDIGECVHIASGCSLQAGGSKITLGDFVGLAAGVKIFAARSNYFEVSFDLPEIPLNLIYGSIKKEIILGPFVWLGSNCVVLPGTILPDGIAIGALNKISNIDLYKNWHFIAQLDPLIQLPRVDKDGILEQAFKLTGKKY